MQDLQRSTFWNNRAQVWRTARSRKNVPLDGGGQFNSERLTKQYQETVQAIATLSGKDEKFKLKCNDSIDAVSAELAKGYKQILQANRLYSSLSIDLEEYYLRVNYAGIFVGDASFRVAFCQDALSSSS